MIYYLWRLCSVISLNIIGVPVCVCISFNGYLHSSCSRIVYACPIRIIRIQYHLDYTLHILSWITFLVQFWIYR